MTNPGDSDEWWKKYGSDGTPGAGGAQAEPTQYSSAPQFQPQPAPPPAAPVTPPPQAIPPQSPYGSMPQYPVQDNLTPPPQPQAQPMPPQPAPPVYPQAAPVYPQAQPAPMYPQGQPAPGYGYPNPGAYQPYGYQQDSNNGMAIASLVSSLIGLCTCLGGIVGVILGVIALNQIKERGGRGRGMALAGIWIGAITIVLGIGWVILDFALLSHSSSSTY